MNMKKFPAQAWPQYMLRTTALAFLLQSSAAFSADSAHSSDKKNSALPPVAAKPVRRNATPALAAFPELDSLLPYLLQRRDNSSNSNFITHAVKPGETVDAVMRKYWAELPFKEGYLRKVVFAMNPDAMRTATVNTFTKGAIIVLPSSSALRDGLLHDKPHAVEIIPPAPQPEAVIDDDPKYWIRFP